MTMVIFKFLVFNENEVSGKKGCGFKFCSVSRYREEYQCMQCSSLSDDLCIWSLELLVLNAVHVGTTVCSSVAVVWKQK